MKKETLLFAAVIALLLLNLGTLGYLFVGHGAEKNFPDHERADRFPPPAGNPLDRKIIETLKLDPHQQMQFDTLKRAHHEAMMRLDREYEDELRNYFALLRGTDDRERAPIETKLADLQREKANLTFEHFLKLKSILSSEQLPQFDSLLPELMHVILPPPRAPGPPHEGPPEGTPKDWSPRERGN